MDVDLRDLELLSVLDEAGTLTRAAGRLFVSQPALSQRLAKMETRLGVPLFDRDGRRLVANDAGRRMLLAASAVLGELASARRDIDDLRAGRHRRVRVTAQCTTAYHWLPDVVRAFREQHPGVEVRIEQVPGDDPVRALLEDRVDVALLAKPDRLMEHIEARPLFDDQMVAVVRPDHAWSGRQYVTARDFEDVHLVLYDIYDQSRVPRPALPLPAGSRPGRISTVPLITDLVVEMVASGEGVSVLPRWVAAPYADGTDPRVSLVQIGRRPEARTWHLATRPDEQPTPVADFAALVSQHFTTRPAPTAAPPAA